MGLCVWCERSSASSDPICWWHLEVARRLSWTYSLCMTSVFCLSAPPFSLIQICNWSDLMNCLGEWIVLLFSVLSVHEHTKRALFTECTQFSMTDKLNKSVCNWRTGTWVTKPSFTWLSSSHSAATALPHPSSVVAVASLKVSATETFKA